MKTQLRAILFLFKVLGYVIFTILCYPLMLVWPEVGAHFTLVWDDLKFEAEQVKRDVQRQKRKWPTNAG